MLGCLELQLQVVVRRPTLEQGTELGSSARARRTLNYRAVPSGLHFRFSRPDNPVASYSYPLTTTVCLLITCSFTDPLHSEILANTKYSGP